MKKKKKGKKKMENEFEIKEVPVSIEPVEESPVEEAPVENAKEEEKLDVEEYRQQKISPPWFQYVNAVNALFNQDPEVHVDYDDEHKELKLFVDSQTKADAIAKLLPTSKTIGTVSLIVSVIPSNNEMSMKELFNNAFSGNPGFVTALSIDNIFTNPLTYVVFRRLIAQYFIDDIGDYHGNRSVMLQDLAKELFDNLNGVFFCTESEEGETQGDNG